MNKARPAHLFSSEYQNSLMSLKSKSQSTQNVKMFNIFSLESLDASCKDYLIINVGALIWLANLPTRVQAEMK